VTVARPLAVVPAFDTATIEAKMTMPSLLTWIEEQDNFICYRV
jgi:hypothetical protein